MILPAWMRPRSQAEMVSKAALKEVAPGDLMWVMDDGHGIALASKSEYRAMVAKRLAGRIGGD